MGMIPNRTKVSMFGAAGFLIAILIIAITPMMIPVANAGTLIIKLTDAPVDLAELFLTIDSFEVRDESGSWMEINIPVDGGRISFDLLTLDGVTIDGANGELDGGHYDMIRMHIVEGLEFTNATKNEADAEPFSVRVPSDKIKIPVEFDIEAGATTIVILDILPDAEWRIAIAENPQHNLNPVIKPIVIPPTE